MNTPKRFIAGAVCPRCGELDKLVQFREDGCEFRQCVRCDFRDEMGPNGPVSELPTRVNQVEEAVREEGVQVIQIAGLSKSPGGSKADQ